MPETTQLIFATSNENKVQEIQSIVHTDYKIVSLKDLEFHEDIPEPYDTFHENAQTKAITIYNRFGLPCFAEDSGLMVDALKGAPGVLSARYAGEPVSHSHNIEKVLHEMQDVKERQASFITVICYYDGVESLFFEGRCTGQIIETTRGEQGFGYDPIFIPDGDTRTFAEMDKTEKSKYSHRAKALKLFLDYLAPHDKKD